MIEGKEHDAAAFDKIAEHLEAASSSLGRSIKLNARVRSTARWLAVLGLSLLVVAFALAWHFQEVPILTVGGLALTFALLPIHFMLRPKIADWANLIQDPRKALRLPVQTRLGALALSALAIHALRYDDDYIEEGRLAKYPGLS